MAPKFTELRRLRRWHDLTQAELAKKAGVSLTVVESAEQGHHAPNYGSLAKLADALGVDVAEILPNPKENAPKPESEAEGRHQVRTARSKVAPITGKVTVDVEVLVDTLRDLEMGIISADVAEDRLLVGVA